MTSLFELLESTPAYRRLKYSLNSSLAEFLLNNTGNGQRDLVVAELACGSGYGSHILAAHPCVRKSIALDINQNLFDEKFRKEFRANYIIGDIFQLPFAPDTFDLAWNSSAVEHFVEPLEAIEAMAGVVKPGGYIFVGVPYRYGPLATYYLAPTKKSRDWLGKPYTLSELIEMMDCSGLVYQNHLIYFFRFFIGILAIKKYNRRQT